MNKLTLHLAPVDGSPFSVELEPERILCNDITLPFEHHPHNMRLWVIGNIYGAVGAVWASCEQDALDELIDSNLGDCFLVSEEDQKTADEAEQAEWAHLGNAGEPCDLTDAWIQAVAWDLKRDCELLCRFAEARGANVATLDF